MEVATDKTTVNLNAGIKDLAQVSGQHFELVLGRQQELMRFASNIATTLASASKMAEGIVEHQHSIDDRLESIYREIVKRARITLVVQVLSFIILAGTIAFLIFRR